LRNNFKEIYNNYISYLNNNVPEIGDILSYWDDPLKSRKTRSILLPYAHNVDNNTFNFNIEGFVFIVEHNPLIITLKQIGIMESLFTAIHSKEAPETGLIIDSDYFPPTPEAQNIGVIRFVIKLTIDYLDDCE